jgi:hypothetical protein
MRLTPYLEVSNVLLDNVGLIYSKKINVDGNTKGTSLILWPIFIVFYKWVQ